MWGDARKAFVIYYIWWLLFLFMWEGSSVIKMKNIVIVQLQHNYKYKFA